MRVLCLGRYVLILIHRNEKPRPLLASLGGFWELFGDCLLYGIMTD